MNVEVHADVAVALIAAAIGEPARARMLFSLMDNRARTSTELACVAEVTPATASVHLSRLKSARLIKVMAQGKHRYYSLNGPYVASALEGLSVLTGAVGCTFVVSTPKRLVEARTCYDHIAGTLGVLLHDKFTALNFLSANPEGSNGYEITANGVKGLQTLGINIEEARTLRRRLAFACLDWSERRPHLGGALGAALFKHALKNQWVVQDLDSRALAITSAGRRKMRETFGLQI